MPTSKPTTPDPYAPAGKPLPRAGWGKRPRGPARVKWRIKGEVDGPVYQGTREVRPCRGCAQRRVL